MPQSEEETRDATYIAAFSTLVFVFTVTGGSFLLTYVLVPESRRTSWFPYVGISLVGIPWLIWLAALTYRCFVDPKMGDEKMCVLPVKGGGSVDSPKRPWMVGRMANESPLKPLMVGRMANESPGSPPGGGRGAHIGGALSDSPGDSPANGRRVRFGGVVVLGSGQHGAAVVQIPEERGGNDDLEGGGALT